MVLVAAGSMGFFAAMRAHNDRTHRVFADPGSPEFLALLAVVPIGACVLYELWLRHWATPDVEQALSEALDDEWALALVTAPSARWSVRTAAGVAVFFSWALFLAVAPGPATAASFLYVPARALLLVGAHWGIIYAIRHTKPD